MKEEIKKENAKLKQALDILIRKLDIRLTKTENYDTTETYYSVHNENSCELLYPEEYELLKECYKSDCVFTYELEDINQIIELE